MCGLVTRKTPLVLSCVYSGPSFSLAPINEKVHSSLFNRILSSEGKHKLLLWNQKVKNKTTCKLMQASFLKANCTKAFSFLAKRATRWKSLTYIKQIWFYIENDENVHRGADPPYKQARGPSGVRFWYILGIRNLYCT